MKFNKIKVDLLFCSLCLVYVAGLLSANTVAGKWYNITFLGLPIVLTAANIPFSITYLITDIVSQKYGKAQSTYLVIAGLFTLSLYQFFIWVDIHSPSANTATDHYYTYIFGLSMASIIIGAVVYCVSQLADISIFSFIRSLFLKKFGEQGDKYRWVWNNASTLISQAIDTILYQLLFFGLYLGMIQKGQFHTVWHIIFAQYAVRVVLAFCDTPIFLLFTAVSKKRGVENGKDI